MSKDYVISFRPDKKIEMVMRELVANGENKTKVLSEAIMLYYLLQNAITYKNKLYTASIMQGKECESVRSIE